MTTSATESLIEFVQALDITHLPAVAVHQAKRAVFDLLAVSLAGSRTSMAKTAQAFAHAHMAPGRATVIGARRRLAVPGATWANAIAASALDLDDGHRDAMGHPGAAVIPAALAAAEDVQATGAAFLSALVAGYEVAVRASVARQPMFKERQYASGIWGVYGAAAAVAKLLRLDHRAFQNALGIALGHGPFPPSGAFTNDNMVKEGVGWSAMTGCAAAYLAQAGFHGPSDALDRSQRFWPELLTQNLPENPGESHAITQIYFKPHAACRWAHSAIDAILDMVAAEQLHPAEVKAIHVAGFYEITRLADPKPQTPIAAQFSIPFCLATALIHGRVSPDELSEEHLHNPATLELARRVHLHVEPELDDLFPAQTAVHLTVQTTRGDFARSVFYPRGNPENPLTDQELQEKACRLTQDFLGAEQVAALWAVVQGMDAAADVFALSEVLQAGSM